jgi:5'(3')-deoxyribonucleotidase
MLKPIIAVDIDDVLAHHAEAIVAYSNKTFGPGHSLDNYTEHWAAFWNVDLQETQKRAHEYHLTDDMAGYRAHDTAFDVLEKLKKNYRLIIVTARRQQVVSITKDWIKKYFPGVFDDIYHIGIWDVIKDDSHQLTKADLCVELGVSYLIDDQIKHCNAAAAAGIEAVLFGDYPWQGDEVNTKVHRCHDWPAVERFFNERAK